MGTIATIIISAMIGGTIGVFGTALFISSKDDSVRHSAMTIKYYCEDKDCYDCDLRRADGSCKVRDPMKWTIDNDGDE